MGISHTSRHRLSGCGLLCGLLALPAAAWTPLAVTNDPLVRMPGTQPGQVVDLEADKQCLSCHGGFEMDHWKGSMMGQASRDPLFWSAMVVAAQDSIWALGDPNAADLCLRCHFPQGWLDKRSDPPNASLMRGEDYEGVSCKICHYLYNPHFKTDAAGGREGADWTNYWDEAGSLSAPAAAATYAADAAAAAQIMRFNGQPFFTNDAPHSALYNESGGGQYFLSTGARDSKRGPFADAVAKHEFLYSRYHKGRYICGTCHDVSNPALHNLGSSGTNTLPSEINPADSYYHIERTFSEFMLSGYSATGGLAGTGPYATNVFKTSHAGNKIATCQDCHFRDLSGQRAGNSGVVRPGGSTEHPMSGVPEHRMIGGNAWVPAILASIVPTSPNYDPTNSALLRQGPAALTLDFTQGEALDPFMLLETSALAQQMMQSSLSMTHASYSLSNRLFTLRLQNHTPHKLISGFPEGRRMFLNIKGYVNTQLVCQINPYDTAAHTLRGLEHSPSSPPLGVGEEHRDDLVYEVHHQSALLGSNVTFHIVLATGREKDNRIPPRGFRIAEAAPRLCEPVWHGQSDTNYFTAAEYAGGYDEVTVSIPAGIERIEAGLYYQTTSREFVEFLRDEINGVGGTLPGQGAGGDAAYLVQTDPWFAQLKAWGNTLWSLWDHNKHLPGAAPVLMTNTFVQLELTDTDLDGIPAYWESFYFGGATNALPMEDSDGDGVRNLDEYLALTDPTSSNSVFTIAGIQGGVPLSMAFTSHVSRLYGLSFTTNLVDGVWSNLPAFQFPESALSTLYHTNPAAAGYYKVRVSTP